LDAEEIKSLRFHESNFYLSKDIIFQCFNKFQNIFKHRQFGVLFLVSGRVSALKFNQRPRESVPAVHCWGTSQTVNVLNSTTFSRKRRNCIHLRQPKQLPRWKFVAFEKI